jgi:hypothetical protein
MPTIFGYTIVNNVTARDRQRNHKQWFLGKALETFCPMVPWIATSDLDQSSRNADQYIPIVRKPATMEILITNGHRAGRVLRAIFFYFLGYLQIENKKRSFQPTRLSTRDPKWQHALNWSTAAAPHQTSSNWRFGRQDTGSAIQRLMSDSCHPVPWVLILSCAGNVPWAILR